MTYRYEYNDRMMGDRYFETDAYRLIQQGLEDLRQEVEIWNGKARASGADPPYEREIVELSCLIEFGAQELERKRSVVWFRGISIGSMRYLRAGMELILKRRRDELEKNRAGGWPSGALESLRKALDKTEQVASCLDVRPADILWEVIPEHESGAITSRIRKESIEALWDAFISHASEDKSAFVRPLAEALQGFGLRIWFDELSLRVGDSLRRSIDKGLSRARYGIVVLSPSFFAKEWPQRELDGLVAREVAGQKVILPIWHNIDFPEVCQYSPTLADRVAARSQDGLQRVVQDMLAVLKPGN
jgi:TIR domain